MGIRERMLPPGWYPSSASGCRTEIEQFVAGVAPLPAGVQVLGGIVPHAGWYFSGKAAARVFYLCARGQPAPGGGGVRRPPGRRLPSPAGERRGLGDPPGDHPPGPPNSTSL